MHTDHKRPLPEQWKITVIVQGFEKIFYFDDYESAKKLFVSLNELITSSNLTSTVMNAGGASFVFVKQGLGFFSLEKE